MKSHPIDLSRIVMQALAMAVCAVCAWGIVSEARANPRTERIIERRIMRLEAMERRMEAAAELPPRPVDVRRAIRAGVPVEGFTTGPVAPGGIGPRPRPAMAGPRGVSPQPSVNAMADPAARPMPVQPQPVRPPADPGLQFPESPALAREPVREEAAASPVSPATAIDDGTQSVLVGEPTPAPPPELLPTPPSK
jgi:hypothetical protein